MTTLEDNEDGEEGESLPSSFEFEKFEHGIALRFYAKINFYQFKWIFHCRFVFVTSTSGSRS